MENTLPQNSQFQFETQLPVTTSNNSNTLKLAVVGLLVLLPVVGVSGYYLGTKKSPVTSNEVKTTGEASPSPTVQVQPLVNIDSATPTPADSQPTQKPGSTTKSLSIPADWKAFTAADPDFGVKTTLSLPPGYSFTFSSSDFTIQNDSDATELWNYSTSIFNGKDGLKNYYSGQSRRDWYQSLLNQDFMSEKVVDFIPAKISSVTERKIGGSSYLEISVSGGQYSATGEKHFVYVKNGVVHILKPASYKSNTTQANIPQDVGSIFTSLSSVQIK